MRQWVISLTTGFLSPGNYCSLVSCSFQEEFIFQPRPPGKAGRAGPFSQIWSRRLDREVHGLCPVLWFLWCTNTLKSWQKVPEGCSSSCRPSAIHGCPTGLWFCNFQIPANRLQRMPQFQTSIFTWGTCTFWWVHAFPITGTVTIRQNTKLYLPHPI